jgi:hypothetical protein
MFINETKRKEINNTSLCTYKSTNTYKHKYMKTLIHAHTHDTWVHTYYIYIHI